ncbi:ABC-type polysaccharide/polyol phosphate export systems, permease component (plasmid) [Hoeflea sp. IMCC20628]|nr:ABC-type polysaccharide/polyol phosphate export systems, permease component [Hoeflea sp. IMCC20628]
MLIATQIPIPDSNGPDITAMNTLTADLKDGFSRYTLAVALAREDLLDRYRRSFVGIAWIVISFLLFIGVKSMVFSGFFLPEDYDFFSHLVIGFAIFSFINLIVTQGANLFFANRTWILSSSTPYTVYIHSLVIRAFIELALVSVTSALLIVAFGDVDWRQAWIILPGAAVYYVTAFGLCLLTAPLSVSIKDIVHALQAVMRVTFFATPIIWVAEPDTLRGTVAFWNPLTYYIDIVRVPLLESRFPSESWIVVGVLTTLICFLGAVTFNRLKPRVAISL